MELKVPVDVKKMMIDKIDRSTRQKKIKERFKQLLNSSLDSKISVHLNSIQKIANLVDDVVKDNSQINILLVDDLAYISRTVSYMLQNEGFKVFIAKNGTEGIILFQNIVPDIVITDILLPDFNGIELAALIRKLDETVPIIFITAIDKDMECRHYNLAKNRMAYLQKPIRKEVILGAIHKLLSEDYSG